MPVGESHLKLGADNRQDQSAEFGVLEHLLSAIDPKQPDHLGKDVFRLFVDRQERVVASVPQKAVLEKTLKGSFLVRQIGRSGSGYEQVNRESLIFTLE